MKPKDYIVNDFDFMDKCIYCKRFTINIKTYYCALQYFHRLTDEPCTKDDMVGCELVKSGRGK